MTQIDAGLSLFICLISIREELRARETKKLPRYCERDHQGNLSFLPHPFYPRVPLPNDPTTPEFRRAYNEALVDAIYAEAEHDNDE